MDPYVPEMLRKETQRAEEALRTKPQPKEGKSNVERADSAAARVENKPG